MANKSQQTKEQQKTRMLQLIACLIIVLAVLGIGYSLWNLNTSNAGTSDSSSCSYDISPEESGLTPTIYVDLKDGESMDLTFGELTKFHAECQRGKIRYWILTIDDFCVRQTIELSSDGTWTCTLKVNGMEAWSMRVGGLWVAPLGNPENGWDDTPYPLITPVPVPPDGSVTG